MVKQAEIDMRYLLTLKNIKIVYLCPVGSTSGLNSDGVESGLGDRVEVDSHSGEVRFSD